MPVHPGVSLCDHNILLQNAHIIQGYLQFTALVCCVSAYDRDPVSKKEKPLGTVVLLFHADKLMYKAVFCIGGIIKGTAQQFLQKHFSRGEAVGSVLLPEYPPVPSLLQLLLLGCQNISPNEAVWPEATITCNPHPAERDSGSAERDSGSALALHTQPAPSRGEKAESSGSWPLGSPGVL